jgi:hypothetical protein
MEAKNVDDVLVKTMNDQMGIKSDIPVPPVNIENTEQASQETKSEAQEITKEKNKEEITHHKEEEQKKEPEKLEDQSPIDEYGNPVEKQRLYTEEEVQNKIRERLSRVKSHEPQVREQVQDASKGFEQDTNSDEAWDVQLERFIDQAIDKKQKKVAEDQWRSFQEQKQIEFESKFTSGMNKYKDFHEVVSGKPVTDTMMLATRGLSDPAAFVYGASKLHPQELERISKIQDPYYQAAEVGRLHERMVKERSKISSASRPLETPKGDIPAKPYNAMPSLESRIDQYAKQKRR